MNKLSQVKVYRTSDGKDHKTRLEALLAERSIELRGVINSTRPHANNDTMTVLDVIKLVVANGKDLMKVVYGYDKAIKKERESGLKVATNHKGLDISTNLG